MSKEAGTAEELSKMQKYALMCLVEGQLRPGDIAKRYDQYYGEDRTTGWNEELGTLKKAKDKYPESLRARGLVSVVPKEKPAYFKITHHGRKLATASLSDNLRTESAFLGKDVRAILRNKKIGSTFKERLIDARLGQGKFRSEVLKAWGNCCAVTGSMTHEAIRASHIKPWRDSSDEERLDPLNGLPLVANLDALFDAHLISFDPKGRVIVSTRLSRQEQALLGIVDCTLRTPPTDGTEVYLTHHRKTFFEKQ